MLAVLIIGTLGYWLITGRQYSLIDTLYMTVITVTTIGYGEVIDLSGNPAGRIFTMFIAIAGIGVVAYGATNFAVFLFEGEFRDTFRRRRMENTAKNSRDHYIVCGAGTTALHIIDELSFTKRSYVVIEPDKNNLDKLSALHKDAVYVEGDPTSNEIMLKANIEQARGVFAVSGDDNLNLVISLTAKQLNPALRVVAECHNKANEEKMRKVCADSVVTSTYISGLRMASEMVRPAVVTFLDIMMRDRDKNLRIEEIAIPDNLTGKKLGDSGLKSYPGSLLMAVRKNTEWVYNPHDSYVIGKDDVFVFMTNPDARAEMEKYFKQR